MDCKNVNLEELMEKAKKYDELLKSYEASQSILRENLLKIEEFFQFNFAECNSLYQHSWGKDIIYCLEKCLDSNHQAKSLAEERVRYRNQYNQQETELFSRFEYEKQELLEAWEKFRAIKTKKYQQTLKEINEEIL